MSLPENVRGMLKDMRENNTNIPKNYIFLSVSGSHIYGTPNVNSDIDIRGCHVEPTKTILSLNKPNPTINGTYLNLDYETHELEKFLNLMLKCNGNIIENVLSPLIIYESEHYERLKILAERCISKQIYHHYKGFSYHMLNHVYSKDASRYKKNVMYCYRNILCGIHVLETGKIIHHLPTLLDFYNIEVDLVNPAPKLRGLLDDLDVAYSESKMKEKPDCYKEVNEFLLKIRFETC